MKKLLLALLIITEVVGLASLAMFIYAYYTRDDTPFKWPNFNYLLHAFSLLCGMCFFMGNASLMFRFGHLCCSHNVSKAFHSLLHVLALGAIAFGMYCIIKIKEDNKNTTRHFNSTHSWVGAFAILCFVLQFFFGLFTYGFKASSARCRASTIKLHRGFGLMIFVAAASTISLKIDADIFPFDRRTRAFQTLTTNQIVGVTAILAMMLFILLVVLILASWRSEDLQEKKTSKPSKRHFQVTTLSSQSGGGSGGVGGAGRDHTQNNTSGAYNLTVIRSGSRENHGYTHDHGHHHHQQQHHH